MAFSLPSFSFTNENRQNYISQLITLDQTKLSIHPKQVLIFNTNLKNRLKKLGILSSIKQHMVYLFRYIFIANCHIFEQKQEGWPDRQCGDILGPTKWAGANEALKFNIAYSIMFYRSSILHKKNVGYFSIH